MVADMAVETRFGTFEARPEDVIAMREGLPGFAGCHRFVVIAAPALQPPAGANAIVFDRVSIPFDDHVVLKDLSFTVPKGDMRILFGISGAGKSVILKLALGLLRPDEGAISVNGMRVDQMPEQELLEFVCNENNRYFIRE